MYSFSRTAKLTQAKAICFQAFRADVRISAFCFPVILGGLLSVLTASTTQQPTCTVNRGVPMHFSFIEHNLSVDATLAVSLQKRQICTRWRSFSFPSFPYCHESTFNLTLFPSSLSFRFHTQSNFIFCSVNLHSFSLHFSKFLHHNPSFSSIAKENKLSFYQSVNFLFPFFHFYHTSNNVVHQYALFKSVLGNAVGQSEDQTWLLFGVFLDHFVIGYVAARAIVLMQLPEVAHFPANLHHHLHRHDMSEDPHAHLVAIRSVNNDDSAHSILILYVFQTTYIFPKIYDIFPSRGCTCGIFEWWMQWVGKWTLMLVHLRWWRNLMTMILKMHPLRMMPGVQWRSQS